LFGSRKPAAAWFVNCNMKQHVYASTSELKTEQPQIASAFLDSVHAKADGENGAMLVLENGQEARIEFTESIYEIPNCIAYLKKRIYTDYRVRKKELLDHTGTGIALPVHSNLHHVFIIIYYILLFANVLIRFTEFKP
jgi:hypothetical protein